MYNVSVIVPYTPSRENYYERIMDMYNSQDYEAKEIIFLDGERESIGSKLNMLCRLAMGDIILRMDSDDLYSSEWITKSVNALIDSGADLIGMDSAYFLNSAPEISLNDLYFFANTGKESLIMGATMCFWKKTWDRIKFDNISKGEDQKFCRDVGNIAVHGHVNDFCAIIHGENTASHLQLPYMRKVQEKERRENIKLSKLLQLYGY